MLWRCKRQTSQPAGPELVDPVTQSVIGQSHSAASRRVDLLRTDWLQAQRTRSHSSRTPVRATWTSPLVCTCSELEFSLVFMTWTSVNKWPKNFDERRIAAPPQKKLSLALGDPGPHLVHSSTWIIQIHAPPKRHLDRFSRFSTAHRCVQQTNT